MIDCSKTENYFKEKARMTKREKSLCCNISCRDCPLCRTNTGEDYACGDLQNIHPDKAVAIVQKWSDEHPRKTYKDDFFETECLNTVKKAPQSWCYVEELERA